ncbi:MAG: PSD1 domain-containing protein [Verrucomicrobiales bacterium]|nr:PSD1 domain-containing protein [Verrucomicrobiales bacterium]
MPDPFPGRGVVSAGAILIAGLALLCVDPSLMAADATFYRAINLNGPACRIDGRNWEGQGTTNLVVRGKTFENQAVALRPATDSVRASMIRSSVWGSSVDIQVTEVPRGEYQVFLYVWEDNHSERFDLLVNDQVVVVGFHSGAAGAWKRLGPWRTAVTNGQLTVSARGPSHGAANLSGLEIWTGEGPIPSGRSLGFVTQVSTEQTEFFERRIRPVLAEQCYACHSARAEKLKGNLFLDSRAGIIKGGDSGPVITPGEPEASLLLQAVRHTDPGLVMPPKGKLTSEQIVDLEAWILMGAPDPRTEDTPQAALARSAIDWTKAKEWWSFRPLRRPVGPVVQGRSWARQELDTFVLARLEAAGLAPAPEASREVLIRRATFDLIGLPPTPEEVEGFVTDPSPRAFEIVIERLLASPRYGERWGRHWLDVVRYADTAGDNSDFPIPQMRHYRDWVIRAFNRDLPYDEFVTQQIAGDLLGSATPEQSKEQLVATGYLANARRFGSRVDDYPQHLTIEDTLDNLGRTFLGLTLNCARCHDHKFDPITASDYYALYGIFHSTRYPWPGIELDQRQRDLVPLVSSGERRAALQLIQDRESEQRKLDGEIQRLKEALKTATTADQPAAKETLKSAEARAAEHRSRPLPFEMAYAVAEAAKPEDVPVQIKGDPAKLGPTVPRRFLTILGGAPFPPGLSGSGRRELAAWLTGPDNPLTARVMVNRIWLNHFGKGLVATPNDFGKQGKPPSHPELLDFLATEFIRSGWSVKAMHRRIMLSSTYQQSSHRPARAVEQDPGNETFSGYPRRRLDAESLRDSLLWLGGDLDLRLPGAHPFPAPKDWKFTQHNPFRAVYDSRHRSVYLMTQRIQRHPYLAIFDGADPAASTAFRTRSTTPLQALHLLNDGLVHEQAKRFAGRIVSGREDQAARIRLSFRQALGRVPAGEEVSLAVAFLDRVRERSRASGASAQTADVESWQAYARTLFRLNEFVYLD